MRRFLAVLALCVPLSGCVSSFYMNLQYYPPPPRFITRYQYVCEYSQLPIYAYGGPCYYVPVRVPVF